jgi:hypothetical protein
MDAYTSERKTVMFKIGEFGWSWASVSDLVFPVNARLRDADDGTTLFSVSFLTPS